MYHTIQTLPHHMHPRHSGEILSVLPELRGHPGGRLLLLPRRTPHQPRQTLHLHLRGLLHPRRSDSALSKLSSSTSQPYSPFILLHTYQGLIILMGLIVYISTFKAEVGPKLRSRFVLHDRYKCKQCRSELDPPKFKYKYGYSFHILIASFLFSEVAGRSSIGNVSTSLETLSFFSRAWEISWTCIGCSRALSFLTY